jgi:hypothetical protein
MDNPVTEQQSSVIDREEDLAIEEPDFAFDDEGNLIFTRAISSVPETPQIPRSNQPSSDITLQPGHAHLVQDDDEFMVINS